MDSPIGREHSEAMSLRRRAVQLVAPVVGAAYILLWIVAEIGRGPSVVVFALFGISIALAVAAPRIALVVLFAGLAASTVATAISPTLAVGWFHPMTATDWPAYAAAMIVPGVVAARASRRSLRISLIAAGIAPIWLAALIASATELPWNHGRLVEWFNIQFDLPEPIRAFLAFSVILLVLSALLWVIGWGIGGAVRFIRTMLRDPVLRVRFNDAFRLSREVDGPALTARERDVLLLVSDGKSNAEIAKALFLSEATVKSHLRSILTKLGLKSRTEIVAHAWRSGMVQAP
jgi:DNA-binding CsgD family transcriptional regulator